MALINCPECNQEVSDWAKSCPQCAFPIEEFIKKQAEEQALSETKEPDSAREEEKPERKGTLVLPEGKEYEGETKDNKPHGQGVIILPDGKRFVGGFINGKADGYGALFDKNGKKLKEGIWKDNELESLLGIGNIIIAVLVPIIGIIVGISGLAKKRKGAGGLLAIGIGVSILFMLFIGSCDPSTPSTSSRISPMSDTVYSRITVGMTKEQVREIAGSPHNTQTFEGDIMGYYRIDYWYYGPQQNLVQIQFENGRVSLKARY